MSYDPRKYQEKQANDKRSRKPWQQPVKKAILRNPEVEIKSSHQITNKPEVSVDFSSFGDEIRPQVSSRKYHEPRLNQVQELEERLREIELYEAKRIESLSELSVESQSLANRKISSKLNVPSSQHIFSNLTQLDDKKSPDLARKAANLIQTSARKVTNRKSLEVREEIHKLINELVDLEYKEADLTPKLNHLPNEDDFFGISKFSSPNFMDSKKKDESNYLKSINAQISQEFFKSESYLATEKWQPPEDDVTKPSAPTCQCLKDFYNQHSTCS